MWTESEETLPIIESAGLRFNWCFALIFRKLVDETNNSFELPITEKPTPLLFNFIVDLTSESGYSLATFNLECENLSKYEIVTKIIKIYENK